MTLNSTIAHYKIVAKLGEGAMGVVYKAEDLTLRRTVALKFLSQDLVGFTAGRTRFLHEAQAAAMINHPNVCSVYGFEEVGDRVFIVMAFVEGSSLANLLSSDRVRLRDALRIAIEIGEGLRAAHAKRVVHRDIKPGNVLIATDGQVRITDFGLALLAERTRITKPGTIMGTAAYMSPEQAQTTSVDHRSDIWSLGVVLYEMIAGVRPFRGKDPRSMLVSVVRDPVPELRSSQEPLPAFLESVVGKALAKKPEERYQHTDDLVVDLRALLRELPAVPESGVKFAAHAGVSGAPLAPTQTLVASGIGHRAHQGPLKAAIEFIGGKLRGLSSTR